MENRKHKRWELSAFSALSLEQKLLAVAEANIDAYGTIAPPPEDQLHFVDKVCAQCGEKKHGLKDFGIKYQNGKVQLQGWCRSCRSSTVGRPSRWLQTVPKAVMDKLTPEELEAIEEAWSAAKGDSGAPKGPKGPGRPRKNPLTMGMAPPTEKRPVGRPRKA